MKVRLIMVLACNLMTLTGCASTSTLNWLRDEHANAIAEDLVLAVAQRIPPAESAVFVSDMPLRDHFETAIRAHGYAVATVPDEAVTIVGVGERIPPNTWHVGLTIDNGVHIHRLYHVEPDDVHALSAVSVVEDTRIKEDPVRNETSSWHLRTLSKPKRTAVTQPSPRPPVNIEPQTPQNSTGTFLPVVDETAPVPVTPKVSECPSRDGAVFTFSPGSLKQALANELNRCGWTITRWPIESTNPQVVVDWVVTAETRVQIDSIEDLLLGLRAIYGLEGSIDQSNRQISFSMSPDV